MARTRQATKPVDFNMVNRPDQVVTMTSGRAGVVSLIDFVPILRGDSASGALTVSCNLGRMPKPLLNAVTMNIQAWFIPKSAMPQFNGRIELLHSYQGKALTALAAADRAAPPYFFTGTVGANPLGVDYPILKTLGLHHPTGETFQTDLIDAYNLVYNFRCEAFSSKIDKRPYFDEDPVNSSTFARAFWPVGRFTHMVPDYERALVVGALDLDVSAGVVAIEGAFNVGSGDAPSAANYYSTKDGSLITPSSPRYLGIDNATDLPRLYGDLAAQTITTSLADIDKARVTQSFAELRALYAGMDGSGFVNEDAIIAELMQGFSVPDDALSRPWMLDSKRAVFGMSERHATDGANLEDSLSEGQAVTQLSINLPRQEDGGVIIVTCEVVPERLDERAYDPWLGVTNVSMLPDALRDIQRTEPVDAVMNKRLDTAHSSGSGLYGYEPMNYKWNRNFTRLGGAYYQPDPANPWTEQRSALWLSHTQDPTFTDDHWLCPSPFPHDVFMDTTADAWEMTVRHNITIRGITQIGDVLNENNDEYADTESAQ